MMRASAAGYYSAYEALRAAEQLIDLLEKEHAKGYFELEDVTLRSEDRDLVFTGAEYLAFARRGIQDAVANAKAGESLPAKPGAYSRL